MCRKTGFVWEHLSYFEVGLAICSVPNVKILGFVDAFDGAKVNEFNGVVREGWA